MKLGMLDKIIFKFDLSDYDIFFKMLSNNREDGVMNKRGKIDIISIIIIIGFVFAVFYHYVLGTYLGISYPYNTFLFRPNDRFMDFFNMLPSPYLDGKLFLTQFPFGQRLAQSFSIMPKSIAFLVFATFFITFFTYVNYSNLKVSNSEQNFKNVIIFSFMTYPFLFTFDRGNIEIFVFLFLYLFIIFYKKQKILLSIVFLSFAISMKLFPAVFLVLLWSDKYYKEALYAALLVITITLCAYASYDGTLIQAIGDHLVNLNNYNKNYASGNEGLYFGHSLWGVISCVKITFIQSSLQFLDFSLSRGYLIGVFALFILISLYIIFYEKILWKKVALLVFAMNLFPYVSADYKLIHLFLPMLLYINTEESDNHDLLYSVLFGLLLIPKAYFHYDGNPEITSSIILSPMLMLGFMSFVICSGLRSRKAIYNK